jgi:2,3-bisphosphoglycerate-independent phosphoglycerate mutase
MLLGKKIQNLPLLLVILDGWGIAPASLGNAISQARTGNMDRFIKNYPAMTLLASGPGVGLPFGEMGNSEVGHANIGAGRVTYQSLPRISKAISDGSFFRNEVLTQAMERCSSKKKKGGLFGGGENRFYLPKMHFLGILSDSGVHGHMEHLFALLVMAKEMGVPEVYIHCFLDGRDSIYNSGGGYIEKLEQNIKAIGIGKIATISGRFYAMDRDSRYDRIQKAYDTIVSGVSEERYQNAQEAIEASYSKEIFDEEFIPCTIIDGNIPIGTVASGDSVIFFNYRADRARELTHAFVDENFNGFSRRNILKDLFFVTMMEYEKGLPVKVAFQQDEMKNTFGEVIAKHGLRQFRIAETEKYAHVTFFFNGLSEGVFQGEEHILIPSPKVAMYKETPAMSAKELTQRAIKEISSGNADVFILNYANADMVGHTGDREATTKAIEVIDKSLGNLAEVVLSKNGVCVITADHGNAEELLNLQTDEIDKEHSNNPVPFIVVGTAFEGKHSPSQKLANSDLSTLNPQGVLSDVAPTLLHLLNIPKPDEMTGVSLLP